MLLVTPLPWDLRFAIYDLRAGMTTHGQISMASKSSIEMALSRGLAPRTLSFARRDAALLHLESVNGSLKAGQRTTWAHAWVGEYPMPQLQHSWPDSHRLIILLERETARG